VEKLGVVGSPTGVSKAIGLRKPWKDKAILMSSHVGMDMAMALCRTEYSHGKFLIKKTEHQKDISDGFVNETSKYKLYIS
jgi:hypothetical protein